jgi:hypothetical protein
MPSRIMPCARLVRIMLPTPSRKLPVLKKYIYLNFQGERTKRARPRDRLFIDAGFTSMLMRYAHRPRGSFLCFFKKVHSQNFSAAKTWNLQRFWRPETNGAHGGTPTALAQACFVCVF